jgi:hypothetical protein
MSTNLVTRTENLFVNSLTKMRKPYSEEHSTRDMTPSLLYSKMERDFRFFTKYTTGILPQKPEGLETPSYLEIYENRHALESLLGSTYFTAKQVEDIESGPIPNFAKTTTFPDYLRVMLAIRATRFQAYVFILYRIHIEELESQRKKQLRAESEKNENSKILSAQAKRVQTQISALNRQLIPARAQLEKYTLLTSNLQSQLDSLQADLHRIQSLETKKSE